MNDPEEHGNQADPIEPDTGPTDGIADELFVHGLLRGATEPVDRTSRRVAAVMAAIAADESGPRRRRWPWLLVATAAAIALAAIWLARGSAPTAAELWTTALRAAERSGDRRYEVRAAWSGGDIGMDVTGELDLRDAGNYVFRANVEGSRMAIGATDGEPWLAGDEQLVRHLRAHRQGRGPFAMDAAGTVFGSLDAFLASVPETYDVRQEPEPSDGLVHVVAERKRPGPTPARVDAWLDPATHRMRRVGLFWTDDPAAVPRHGNELTGHHHMDLTLLPAVSFAADWFRAERHR
jgi:hypothetical protein